MPRPYNRRWQRARLTFLEHNPLCIQCRRLGATRAAVAVDHIIPHRGDTKLFWDKANWQPLCEAHHNRKSRGELLEQQTGRPTFIRGATADGMPIDPNHAWNRE